MSVVVTTSKRHLTMWIAFSACVLILVAFTIGCSARASELHARADGWARAYNTYWCQWKHWPASPAEAYNAVSQPERDALGGPAAVSQNVQSASTVTISVVSNGLPPLRRQYTLSGGDAACTRS